VDVKLDKWIGKASTGMAHLVMRVSDKPVLTFYTEIQVYQACVLRTLFYGSKSWTPHSCQEHRLNTFHLRNLRRVLGVTWQDRVPNKAVLDPAGIPSMFALLTQYRL